MWLIWRESIKSKPRLYTWTVSNFCYVLLFLPQNALMAVCEEGDLGVIIGITLELPFSAMINEYRLPNGRRPNKTDIILPGAGGGTPKKFDGVCGPGFRNHTLGYGDRGPKLYPWLRKMGQNQTLDNRKYHQINHFWSNFAWTSNLDQILSFV